MDGNGSATQRTAWLKSQSWVRVLIVPLTDDLELKHNLTLLLSFLISKMGVQTVISYLQCWPCCRCCSCDQGDHSLDPYGVLTVILMT